jgi:hypothetical protein
MIVGEIILSINSSILSRSLCCLGGKLLSFPSVYSLMTTEERMFSTLKCLQTFSLREQFILNKPTAVVKSYCDISSYVDNILLKF